ncbi:MAG: hypothetical protein ACREQZ_12655 [Woeseiaceae bacterium]
MRLRLCPFLDLQRSAVIGKRLALSLAPAVGGQPYAGGNASTAGLLRRIRRPGTD